MCKITEVFSHSLLFTTHDLQEDATQSIQGYVCYVVDGVWSLNRTLSDKAPIVCSIVGEGSLLNPEIITAPSSGGTYTYIVESEETTLAKIPINRFRAILQERPELYPLILRHLSYTFQEATECAAVIGTLPPPERVAHCMERLKEYGVSRVSGRRLAAHTAKGRTRALKVRKSLGYPCTKVTSKAGTELFHAGK